MYYLFLQLLVFTLQCGVHVKQDLVYGSVLLMSLVRKIEKTYTA